jgi:glycosyltransferase involved in cell wall biosynthesis
MRVVLVIDDLRIAGAQRVIAQEARALHPRRVAFNVVALAPDADPSFTPELRAMGVDVRHVPGRGLHDLMRVSALSEMIRRLSPDVVHTHLTYANILGTLSARLAHRPSVASIHNVDTNQLKFATPKRRLEGLVLRLGAKRVAVVTEGARVAVAHNFGVPVDQLVVLPNAMDPSTVRLPVDFDRARTRQALGSAPGESLLCNVGRLDLSKGQACFLTALADVRARNPGHRFRALLVGDGPQSDDLHRLAANLGLADRVSLLGVRRDVAEIVAASDVFVLTSLNEGLSQALLEAMALGTPVVATDVGGTSDAVVAGHTGWLIAPGDSGGLARAIDEAVADKPEATTRAAAARQLIERQFSLTSHLVRLEDLYREVAAVAVRG